ncbi:uncharacterized protein LACBIDRAFT_303363 [Laccaria bicolor S238N-H82]|uniref:Predicted protein n=1 Tax=Laccaria bicolor (strain S238N-H82 / ATCC MYA-4686) TaxID=486041 RepID=B0DJD9_LACBS|nr:uncharacterized protein LACBIDRAFT_303363 [Laccaria bicolor S238N-H82]EDR05505.1 predicted protein [Laccaria bicolor S238N-H82]|eukprot:XP_001884063.1 predicted protein [Laccaria bicolor S238N-H82]
MLNYKLCVAGVFNQMAWIRGRRKQLGTCRKPLGVSGIGWLVLEAFWKGR